MTTISMGRLVVSSLAPIAACGAAVVFGMPDVQREPPVETRAATAAPAVLPSASGARNEGSSALTAAQAGTKAVAAALTVPPHSPGSGDKILPVFDIARVDGVGDAVIAGTAAPGATVELLRNGELQDRAVADQSGQFVMVPPRLPPGDIELTLRSRQPDGTFKMSVAVALHLSLKDQPVVEEPRRTTATPVSDGSSPSVVVVPKITTTVVSHGDSLWRISRVTYGTGMRYAVIYEANQHQIRDPNRIYPGQIFVLPKKGR
jgi:nucleoid-associated protein YgaU